MPVSGGSQGEKGELVELENNIGTPKKGINELSISKFRLEIKSNHITGLLSLCY